MKLAFRLLCQYSQSADLVTLFVRLLDEDEGMKTDDMQLSIFIASYIKPFVQLKGDPDNQEGDVLLNFLLDIILPKTLDVMADNAPHILNITQQI